MISVEIVFVSDDGQDLATEREPIGFERSVAGCLGAPDHSYFAITEIEAEQQGRAVTTFDERGAQLIHRDSKVFDLVDVETRGCRNATRDQSRHADKAGICGQHQFDQTVSALVVHGSPSFETGPEVTLAAAPPMFGLPSDTGNPNRILNRKGDPMGSNIDDAKGRVKEAAGDLTGNDKLKHEGKADQAGAKVKEIVEDVKEKVEEVVDDVKAKISKHS